MLRSLGGPLPLEVLNGSPSYINILDALTAWPLVREASAATKKVAAASFKHVSPAGAAVDGDISEALAASQFLDTTPESAPARAYVRARGGDRISSFGDAVAVSHQVNEELARILAREVSDLIIAPGYDPKALEILASKRKGSYLVLAIDPAFEPGNLETRQVFGLELQQERNVRAVTADLFGSIPVPARELESLLVATIALKYTQSNSVAIGYQGQLIGIGAGQQSRIHCTRIACSKAEKWMLQTHPSVLSLRFPEGLGRPERSNAVDQYLLWEQLSTPERRQLVDVLGYEPTPLSTEERRRWFERFEGLVMSSDAFIPFRDNIDRAAQIGVKYVAHAGGSVRDESVRAAAADVGVTVLETGLRAFLH